MSCTFSPEVIQDTITFHGHFPAPVWPSAFGPRNWPFRELGEPGETDMVAVAEDRHVRRGRHPVPDRLHLGQG